MMTKPTIEALLLTTSNWGKSAKFMQALGFEMEFETDHNSGQFRSDSGPVVFIAEVPDGEAGAIHPVIVVPDPDAIAQSASLEIATPLEDTHWGTREMTVRDPDGRIWRLQAGSGGQG